jgi:hypothetical protein
MSWPCQGRCVDAAWISHKGWAYFVKGGLVWRYDILHDKVDLDEGRGFPRAVRWPGLPQSWSTGFDAALNGGNGKVYFFKGREYVRFDIAAAKVDAGPLPIATQWPGLPQTWSTGFDAAVNWGNGKIYFFKGRDALSYDLSNDRADGPRPIADTLRGFPKAWSTGIDTAVNWGNGKVYIFKGYEYVRYDMAGDRVDGDFPRPIASDWHGLMPLIGWTAGPAATMPQHAMAVGQEADGRALFLCAAVVGQATYPGKTWSERKLCNYSDGQREVKTDVYAIATTTLSIAWVAKNSALLDKLIPVGVSPAGRRYYLCRARFGNGIHPGRIEAPSSGCTISYGGRSHTLNDDFEVASAPTTPNPPYIPLIVRMLSALPNSEQFKDVCASEVVYTIRDEAAAARYPHDLPEIKKLIQTISRNGCAMLYKGPAEVPKYARKVEVVLEDNVQNHAPAFVLRHDSDCTLTINPGVFPKSAGNPVDILGLLYHEVTHTVQHSKASGRFVGAFNEGVADLIALRMLEARVSKVGGDWKGGYQPMAYFVDWLDHRYKDFLYKYNMSRSIGPKWSVEVVRELTGKPVDELWQEYQDSLAVTLARPESLLR